MVSLTSVNDRFETPFSVIDGGVGTVFGILDETPQSGSTSSIFIAPRHILRTDTKSLLDTTMVIQSRLGTVFIVGDNGPSETWRGTLWQSFRLFAPTGKYTWQHRQQTLDPLTRLKVDGPLSEPKQIWAALEPLSQEQFDRGMHVDFEQMNFITNADVQPDDVIDNRNVTKVDKLLGLSIGVLT